MGRDRKRTKRCNKNNDQWRLSQPDSTRSEQSKQERAEKRARYQEEAALAAKVKEEAALAAASSELVGQTKTNSQVPDDSILLELPKLPQHCRAPAVPHLAMFFMFNLLLLKLFCLNTHRCR